MKRALYILCLLFYGVSIPLSAQEISLFQQFNGRNDYLAIGNTLNPAENNGSTFCDILPSSSANLQLEPNVSIIKAYLYWAGSGTGDQNVSINDTPIIADDTYNVIYDSPVFGQLPYFACYTDITEFIISNGSGTYQFADLDISPALTNNIGYCENRTNFAGWSIYVVYEDASLPLNQVSLFQGLEIINRNVQELDIELSNINVLDNNGAKIGFLAWEGDNALNFGESLSINNTAISNPPLNLADNAFNGTNTFTNSDTFYNGDLDVYGIENNINIGDTSALIKLTTGGLDENGNFQADLIIINNIITVLNSQLPDATITGDDFVLNCGQNTVELFYTVNNINSTALLPANTPLAFYLDNILIAQSTTVNDISIGESESNAILLNIPETNSPIVSIALSVDDDGAMNGIVDELDETNNAASIAIELLIIPDIIRLPNLIGCNSGFDMATFDLFDALESPDNMDDGIAFYQSLEDLETESNAILIPSNYNNSSAPETIYVRKESPPCYEILEFQLIIENCPPRIPQGFSPNNDGFNDWFNIQGLYDIFTEHELQIYNRYGEMVFEGNNDKPWFGRINRGLNGKGNLVPVGTYYYILNFNDSNYRPTVGWVYVNY